MNTYVPQVVDVGGKLWDARAGRWLRACLVCGQWFHSNRKDACYCTPAHRTRACRMRLTWAQQSDRAASVEWADALAMGMWEQQLPMEFPE